MTAPEQYPDGGAQVNSVSESEFFTVTVPLPGDAIVMSSRCVTGVGVAVAVGVGVIVGVRVGVRVGVTVGVTVNVGVTVGVLVGVAVGVRVGVGVTATNCAWSPSAAAGMLNEQVAFEDPLQVPIVAQVLHA